MILLLLLLSNFGFLHCCPLYAKTEFNAFVVEPCGQIRMYLHEDDHVPDIFYKYDVRATLPQLLVLREADLKQISCVLQLLHLHLH